ncbi:MAG: hypothetical protein ACR2LR_00895 [Hassallia sp.]
MSTRKRPKVYQLRLSEDEWKQLDFYAQSKQISAAEVLREFIKTLPKQDKSSEL